MPIFMDVKPRNDEFFSFQISFSVFFIFFFRETSNSLKFLNLNLLYFENFQFSVKKMLFSITYNEHISSLRVIEENGK